MPNCDRTVSHASRTAGKACNAKFDKRKKLHYADGSKKGPFALKQTVLFLLQTILSYKGVCAMLTPWSNHTCVLSEKDRKGWAGLIESMIDKLCAILRAAEDGKQAIMQAADWDQAADVICCLHRSVDALMLQAVSDCCALELGHESVQARLAQPHDDTPALPVRTTVYPDGRIVVKMPHLPGLSATPKTLQLKRAFESMYDWMGSEIAEKVCKMGICSRAYDKFSLSFYHIFPGNCPSRSMRDNDNYDYKHLIDRITDALGVTDDALRCRLCFASAQTDRLAAGTYVIVTPDGLTLWSVSDLLQARHAQDTPT